MLIKLVRRCSLIAVLISLIFLFCLCSTGGTLSPGDKTTFTVDGISFTMVYVPGGVTFPTGTDDDGGDETVSDAYWIGETEVTYELWSTVYTWATTDVGGGVRDDDGPLYTFENLGTQGSGNSGLITDQHPVTRVHWRDSMVFCNAITEWYNSQNGTSYTAVYTYTGSIIRDSRETNATACDNAVAGATADGFRLLTSMEWELAARYITDGGDNILDQIGEYYPGNYTSGADDAYDQTASSDFDGDGDTQSTGDVAWYSNNSDPDGDSTNSTQIAGTAGNYGGATLSGNANALGLYDMSGNVYELCFGLSDSSRVIRGGNWLFDAIDLRIGNVSALSPSYTSYGLGFRFARTAE